MSTKEKLKKRILSIPSDLTYLEMKSFLIDLDFQVSNKGSTSGSRVCFICEEVKILFHKPHGKNPMKKGTVRKIIEALQTYNRL